MNRRGFVSGAGASLLCAPAIVQVSNIMSVRPLKRDYMVYSTGIKSYSYVDVYDTEALHKALLGRMPLTCNSGLNDLVSGELGQWQGVTFTEGKEEAGLDLAPGDCLVCKHNLKINCDIC